MLTLYERPREIASKGVGAETLFRSGGECSVATTAGRLVVVMAVFMFARFALGLTPGVFQLRV